jgi:hypothetical protein
MKSGITIASAFTLAFLVTGCASTPKMGNIIPAEGGIYQVVTTGETKDAALESALYSAETTCKGRQMRHVVLDQSTEYKGLVTEGTNQTIDKAQEIIAATTGTFFPTLSGENDYRNTMRFKCEP